jgi:hypothetical protein
MGWGERKRRTWRRFAILLRHSGNFRLDLNFRKEQFSAAYVRALAAVVGLSVARPEPDCDSEDLIVSARLAMARIRSPKVSLQLKCSSSLARLSADVAFPLPIKNYDDLRPVNLAVPRMLVVVEVPAGDDPEHWVHQGHDRLCLLHSAYGASLFGYRSVANQTTVTVRIPLEQRLTTATLNSIMLKLGQGEGL